MNQKHTCQIETKTITIEKTSSGFDLTEFGAATKHTASFSLGLITWIFKTLSKLDLSQLKLGHLDRQREHQSVATLSLRSNQSGRFLAIIHSSPKYKKGFVSLCIPVGVNGHGMNIFKAFLEKALPLKQSVPDQPPPPPESSRPDQTKNLLLVASFTGGNYDPSFLATDLADFFDLEGVPEIQAIGGALHMLKFKCEKDVHIVADIGEFELMETVVKFSYWNLSSGTIHTGCLDKRRRWITLLGIPFHLGHREYLKGFCHSLGRLVQFKAGIGSIPGVSAIDILLDNVDVVTLPHFKLIKDRGLKFPIQIIPLANDVVSHEVGASQRRRKVQGNQTQFACPPATAPEFSKTVKPQSQSLTSGQSVTVKPVTLGPTNAHVLHPTLTETRVSSTVNHQSNLPQTFTPANQANDWPVLTHNSLNLANRFAPLSEPAHSISVTEPIITSKSFEPQNQQPLPFPPCTNQDLTHPSFTSLLQQQISNANFSGNQLYPNPNSQPSAPINSFLSQAFTYPNFYPTHSCLGNANSPTQPQSISYTNLPPISRPQPTLSASQSQYIMPLQHPQILYPKPVSFVPNVPPVPNVLPSCNPTQPPLIDLHSDPDSPNDVVLSQKGDDVVEDDASEDSFEADNNNPEVTDQLHGDQSALPTTTPMLSQEAQDIAPSMGIYLDQKDPWIAQCMQIKRDMIKEIDEKLAVVVSTYSPNHSGNATVYGF